ncbi:MAG: hypothetical protein FJZ47_10255 [Candidatus Tectomicrobia bacterium]|uniref:Uncharacterized protein n=1 Tax=Tectimicrobiota bacterium TaxID=2528274 RepID=A0A938B0U6_UNCTE|nr:hypothetical protein [Candidatus Tectomicrobia bacterium]
MSTKDRVDQHFIERCRLLYEQLLPQLLTTHQGQVIAIEPESAEYFLGETRDNTSEQALAHYPDRLFGFFCVDVSPTVVTLREL